MAIELFGNSATFNPFTGQVNLKRVADVIVPIPETVNFIGQDFVSVDLSFVPTRSSVLSLSVEVIDTDGSTIQILTPSIGDGEIQPPTSTQAIWLDTNGYRGVLWINGAYVGKRLKFTGDFQSSVLSGRVYSDVSNSLLLLNKVVLQTAGTYQFTIKDTFDFGDLVIPKKATAYEYICTPASGGGGGGARLITNGTSDGGDGNITTISLFGTDTIEGKAGGLKGIANNQPTGFFRYGQYGEGLYGGKGGMYDYGGGGNESLESAYKKVNAETVNKSASIESYNPLLQIILGAGGTGGTGVSGYPITDGLDGGDAQIEISFYQRVF